MLEYSSKRLNYLNMNEASGNLELSDNNSYNDKCDKKISIVIMAPFIILILQYFSLMFFGILGTPVGGIIQNISKLLVGFAYLYAFPVVAKRNIDLLIKVYFVAVFLFVGNYLFFKENREHVNSLVFPLFFTCLPAFVYTLSIRNFKILYKKMVQTTAIIFVVGTIIAFMVFTKFMNIGVYSMALSYYMLMPAIVYLNIFFEKGNFTGFAVSVLSIVNILLLGARGPLLCIFVFVLIKVINNFKKTNYETMKIYFTLLQFLIFFALFFNSLINYLISFLTSKNISSRSLTIFLKDGFYFNARDELFNRVSAKIVENPLFGIGLAGDRKILGAGVYTHNILLEIIGNFGIILGVLIFSLLIFILIRSILSRIEIHSHMAIIWGSLGFVHLFLSSSYLIDIKFWIFLGIIVRAGFIDNFIEKEGVI